VICPCGCSPSAAGSCSSTSHSGSTLAAGSDAARIVQFVVWQLRVEDLPDDVAEAAKRLAGSTPRPHGWDYRYPDRVYRVSGIPRDEHQRIIEVRSAAPALCVDELLRGPVELSHVLIQPVHRSV
jgi:hypothetical protein